jgi:hypothetical protein
MESGFKDSGFKDSGFKDVEQREAHARAMLKKMNQLDDTRLHKERLWRWALRGIVIQ